MIQNIKEIAFLVLSVLIVGCASSKKVAYVTTGAAIGAGTGYAINQNGKDAAIGGLAGGIAGAVVADVHKKKEAKKYCEGYTNGYDQAQLDVATKDWNENTGKGDKQQYSKTLRRVKVPKREMGDVVYESHYETLEVYE